MVYENSSDFYSESASFLWDCKGNAGLLLTVGITNGDQREVQDMSMGLIHTYITHIFTETAHKVKKNR